MINSSRLYSASWFLASNKSPMLKNTVLDPSATKRIGLIPDHFVVMVADMRVDLRNRPIAN
jgi:hypothetical protein